jgi:hypothetical protein
MFPNRKSIKFTEKQTPRQEVINLKFFYNPEEVPFLTNTLLSNNIILTIRFLHG